jgi:hypothetical protein
MFGTYTLSPFTALALVHTAKNKRIIRHLRQAFLTENSYTILVYFKDFASRADELIGVSTINSRSGRPGFSF